MEISSYHFKHHRITLSAETWPNLFEAFTIKTVRQPFFSKLGEQWFKLAVAPVAEFYAYTCIILADFLLWDRRGIVIPLAIIQKQVQPGLRGKGIKNPHIWTPCRGGLFVNFFSLLWYISTASNFPCVKWRLSSPHNLTSTAGKKAEGEMESMQEFPESSLVPPTICAIREFSRTFYMQRGKRRSKVQSPHNTTQNKARAASSTSTCHRMTLDSISHH